VAKNERGRSASGRFKSGSEHPKAICLEQRRRELEAMDIGSLTLFGPIFRDEGRLRVRASCCVCGEVKSYDVDNIRHSRTTNCACLRGRKYNNPVDLRLAKRCYAILDRCLNPRNRQFHNYGGFRIEFRFRSPVDFVSYVRRELPHVDYLGLQIDRVDNDGHYERGNPRLVSSADNLRNTSRNRYVFYRGERLVAADLYDYLKRDYPAFALSRSTTARLAAKGISPSEILKRKPRRKRN
jgi:hypothetical protein